MRYFPVGLVGDSAVTRLGKSGTEDFENLCRFRPTEKRFGFPSGASLCLTRLRFRDRETGKALSGIERIL